MQTTSNTKCKALIITDVPRNCNMNTDSRGEDYCKMHNEGLKMGNMHDEFGRRFYPRIRATGANKSKSVQEVGANG